MRPLPTMAVALAALCACTKSDPNKAGRDAEVAPAAPVEAVAQALPHPPLSLDGEPDSAVVWFEGGLEAALAEAKSTSKLVFADVGAYWCPPCHQLDEETFVVAEVGAFLGRGYVAIHVDAEKGDGPEIVDRYKVQAYPTILVLEPSGVEKGRIVDFLDATKLVEALKRIEQGENVLVDLAEAVVLDPDDLAKHYRLGHAHALAARRKEAEVQFRAVMVGDPKNHLGLAAKVAYDRALFFLFKLDNDPPGAIEAFKQLQTRYPDSKQATRAYRQIGRLLCAQGREDEAIASLDAMLATDPEDTGLAASYGWFSFRQKCRPAAGLAVVDAALKTDDENADLHYLRAELTHQLGDDESALAAIKRASELEPKTAYYRRQIRRFEALVGS